MLDKIDAYGLSGIAVDYKKLGRNRQAEVDYIAEEVNVVCEYKFAFDETLTLILSGEVEKVIIEEENRLLVKKFFL